MARKALMAGEEGKADAILRSLADLYPPTASTVGDANPATEDTPKPPKAVVDNQPATAKNKEAAKPTNNGNQNFIPGVKSSQGFCGLPAFYNKNLRALKGFVRLRDAKD
ncbi:hypothetical protein PCASD_01452 [Puccinia coronata f. sp. avenae]|uniref:Uncharacterized protein n=1 Tax=Puccinia coronata f. sp. avenae TaxID=200324 RepID=A0A2N5VKK3_9BASI|nr:hypothetical protein PCASD_01452 [Puccinia coronata f. sp. avenae]